MWFGQIRTCPSFRRNIAEQYVALLTEPGHKTLTLCHVVRAMSSSNNIADIVLSFAERKNIILNN